MNREIKFRAWDGAQWSYFTIGQTWTDFMFSVYHDHCSNGKTFYQHTGLKDKNGKEIYEGDILEAFEEDRYKVFFNTSMASFDVEWAGGDCDSLVPKSGWNNLEYEVIGNIYQNPDLL
jgi:hypothetical protein